MIVKSTCTWCRILAQGSNGVHVYLYKGSLDVDNIKIKDDMKATCSEETVCKLNMEASLQEQTMNYIYKNAIG